MKHLTIAVLIILAGLCPAGRTQEKTPQRQAERRPFIVITNDDGHKSEGLAALIAEIERFADVLAVAPAKPSSGSSQSVTFRRKMEIHEISRREQPGGDSTVFYSLDGPPASCVAVAIKALSPDRRPDLVLSGINRGQNVGKDIYSSGTVGAARMAAVLGVPAIAFSLSYKSKRWDPCAKLAAKFVRECLQHKHESLPSLLNVNFPTGPGEKWKSPLLCPPGGGGFVLRYELETGEDGVRRVVPRFGLSKGPFPEGSDSWALQRGHVTVSALSTELEAVEPIRDRLKSWKFFSRRSSESKNDD